MTDKPPLAAGEEDVVRLFDMELIGDVQGVETLALLDGVLGAGVDIGVAGGEPPVDGGASLLAGRVSEGLVFCSDFGVGGGGAGTSFGVAGDVNGRFIPGPPFRAWDVLGVELGVEGGAGVNG